MPIKVDWVDPNSSDSYTVYRQDTPIVVTALPPALGTIPAGTFTYTDNTVVRNKLYYYRVASTKGSDISYSPNKPLAYMPFTGPGPQALLRGDWDFGYFGRMALNDLFSIQECKLFAGNIPTTATDNGATDLTWMKFVYKGKILFVASQNLVTTLTWETLYRAGVVYGAYPNSDWAPYAKTTFGTITQNRQVTKGDSSFILRMPTSRGVMASTSGAQADQIGGEYDLIIPYAFANRIFPDTLGYRQIDDMVNAGYISFSTDLQSNICINRGGGVNPDTLNVTLATNATHAVHGWRPLYELVL